MNDFTKLLTKRERDVLVCRCAEDLDAGETAERLGLSRFTVLTLTQRAYQRLGVHSIGTACFRLGVHGAHLVAVARKERVAS